MGVIKSIFSLGFIYGVHPRLTLISWSETVVLWRVKAELHAAVWCFVFGEPFSYIRLWISPVCLILLRQLFSHPDRSCPLIMSRHKPQLTPVADWPAWPLCWPAGCCLALRWPWATSGMTALAGGTGLTATWCRLWRAWVPATMSASLIYPFWNLFFFF